MSSLPSPVPPPPMDDDHHLADMASELREMGVSKEMEALLARGIHSTRLPKQLRQAKAAEAFDQTFQLIGGVPRLALWADANPDKFYQLYGRMIPQTIAPVLPTTEDGNVVEIMPWITAQRLMYRQSLEIAQDITAKGEKPSPAPLPAPPTGGEPDAS